MVLTESPAVQPLVYVAVMVLLPNIPLHNLRWRLVDFDGKDNSANTGDGDESKVDNQGVVFDLADSVGKLVKQVCHPHRQ
jgi:hypothetical protein